MNKLLIGAIVVAIVALGIGGLFYLQKPAMQEPFGDTTTQPEQLPDNTAKLNSPTPKPAAGTTTGKAVSNTELDTQLQKESTQLDTDIKAGSKDSVNDSDFSF